MFGKNEVKGRRMPEDGFLVKSIWYTIQGEGPYAGFPAIFVRFSDCNLRCFFCDTDFTGGTKYDLDELVEAINKMMLTNRCKLVVLTGGEPMLQDLPGLIKRMTARSDSNPSFQIETAGTCWADGLEDFTMSGQVKIVCSPKTPTIHAMVANHCSDWKYIVRDGETSLLDGLPNRSTQIEGKEQQLYRAKSGVIYVQPCDEGDAKKNYENTQLTALTSMTFGYRLSLQLHKLVGLD
jgi:7-carboxy-7-deazaguanine synthase